MDVPQKVSLEKKVLLLGITKRISVLKDFYGSLLPVTRKWGKLNSAPASSRDSIHLQTIPFFLVGNNPLKFRDSYALCCYPHARTGGRGSQCWDQRPMVV
jgi:hypothetical protein